MTLAKAASTATQHLQYVSVTEDGVTHAQFSTFQRTRGTQVDSKWDTILPWTGHHFARMGQKSGHCFVPMGHHFAQMGHEMGHYFGRMGHERTLTDTRVVSVGVMVKR